ncbi:glycosyltransferase family 2 protein [Methanoculleus sp. 7T]|uniref:glycosyltransferase family 2 protein n=1 Tax=Methanoculleus sp. 7T TaxID=2937282 RepID=UPI0020C0B151|nr:glycosyltransferase family 2 protein [Methanoculleus sp. 7T]MCK8518382.1 glycosyltransferase family 2 protein [Methanoculleus sp. 7T]
MISVVITNYNGRRYLPTCLSSLAVQTYRDFETIVVDNASTDGSAEFVEEHYPAVRIVRNRKNLGFAGGTNAGIRAALGEYILTLNNDTRAEPCFMEHLKSTMDADPGTGMCAAKMLFVDGTINSTGICISRSGAAWDRGMYEPDRGQYDHPEEVFGPCAGAALYRREMLNEIGLFDEDFFLYMEDVDLAFRARLAGWTCRYVPEAEVYHHHGGTAGVGTDLTVYCVNRNVVWYVVKNFPSRLLVTSIPWILGRNLAVVPYYTVKGRGRAIVRSKIDAVRGIPRMLRKRSTIRRRVPESDIKRFTQTWSNIGRPPHVAC